MYAPRALRRLSMCCIGGYGRARSRRRPNTDADAQHAHRPASVVVDIMRLPDLESHREAPEIRSASAPPCGSATLEQATDLASSQPLLAAALPWVGHAQTRSRGTVCGSVAHADPSAELPLVLIALGGEIELRRDSGHAGVAAETFFTGMMSTDLRDRRDDRSRAFSDRTAPGPGYAFREIGRRHGDFAIVACAAMVDARTGVGSQSAASPTGRWRATCRCRAIAALDDALDAFAWDLDARDDLHATAAYRRQLVRRHRPANARGGRSMPRLSARLAAPRALHAQRSDRVAAEAEPRMLLTDFHSPCARRDRHACRAASTASAAPAPCRSTERRRAPASTLAVQVGRRRTFAPSRASRRRRIAFRRCRRLSRAITDCSAASARRAF